MAVTSSKDLVMDLGAAKANLIATCDGRLNKLETREAFTKKCSEVEKNLVDIKYSDDRKIKELQKLATFFHECGALNPGMLPVGDSETACVNQSVMDIAKALYEYGKVKEYAGREDVGYVASDFLDVADKSVACMQCFYFLLLKLGNMKEPSESINQVTFYAFLLCCEHFERDLWTSESSNELADKLLQKHFQVHQTSIEELLCSSDKNAGMFNKLWPFLLSRFSRTNWKLNPAMKRVYQWCLFQIRFPRLSDFLEQVLSPALLLLDDHELDNKLLGIKCVEHIAVNTTKSELSWYGRADVIYDSLQRLTYSHEASVVGILHPCLLKILAVVEHRATDTNKFPIVFRSDDMFQRLLSNMELETKLIMRRSYSKHLTLYINYLGISMVKHFDRLFRVIFSYLEVYDGPCEETRINVLKALRQVILLCWPRIPSRCDEIIKSLVKLLYNTSVDHTLTPDDVKNIMISDAVDCLVLLRRLCPQVTSSLTGLKQLELGPDCIQHINTVLDQD